MGRTLANYKSLSSSTKTKFLPRFKESKHKKEHFVVKFLLCDFLWKKANEKSVRGSKTKQNVSFQKLEISQRMNLKDEIHKICYCHPVQVYVFSIAIHGWLVK